MAEELLFSVNGSTAIPTRRITLAEAGLLERQHLQQWVIDHPELIGDGVKVVTCEYGKWISGGGVATADRLDVLGLDRTGRLVVVELKRDRAPDTVTMQAINYAAMVRRFSLDVLADVHATHLGGSTTPQEARDQLIEWAEAVSDETLSPPRIVLMASDFGPTVVQVGSRGQELVPRAIGDPHVGLHVRQSEPSTMATPDAAPRSPDVRTGSGHLRARQRQ